MSISSATQKILAGIAGAAGSVAGITALLVTVFDWDVSKVTTVVSIVVVIAFLVGYAIDKAIERVNKNLDSKIAVVEEKIDRNEAAAQQRSHVRDLSLCRLELSDLMNNDPENRVAIRKKANHYFCDLHGNDGMGERYTKWSEAYDEGDLSVLSCEVEK